MEAIAQDRFEGMPDREQGVLRLADGRRLGFAEYGDPEGFPVIALHGTPGSRLMFRPADSQARRTGLRLIAPDRPGYGLSSPLESGALAQCADDVEALADALGIGRFAVAGVSGGGPYATACANRLGARVSALALISPLGPVAAPQMREALSRFERLLFLSGVARQARRIGLGAVRRLVRWTPGALLLALRGLSPPADRAILKRPEVYDTLVAATEEGLRNGSAGALTDLAVFAAPWTHDLAAIAAPTVLWHGTEDRIAPRPAAAHLASAIPGCDYRVVAGAGHYWVFDGLPAILDWIAERAADPVL